LASAGTSTAGTTAAELPPDTIDLPPGRYTTPAVPGVSVAVEPGWSSGMVADGTVELRRDAGADGVTVDLAVLADAPSAAAAAAAIEALPGLTVLATSESRMGGLTGPNLELENPTDGEVALATTAAGPIAIGPGQRVWLSMFDAATGVVAIVVRSDVADWDAALLAAEPFLEGVAFDG
jgi:hypothetical protein